ncbi:predicted protein [Nematostella vectensis]|uniref:Uncharacterized protein n=1 Tax=Nematostella vectensis TaxID=45351 RepID=A7RX89_NEMVE|nr:uncharacterized protein LOC5515937 [Nematostella vectensis]EDO43922.1 predicted protein [Nematostella vectensis]|eukprot:XP_001635985.1 predicted protein [Nematostella vectensis]
MAKGLWLIAVALVLCTGGFAKGYLDVIRQQRGDLFTNPRWSVAMTEKGCSGYSHYEACENFDGRPTGAYCYSNENCCKHCQCSLAAPNFLINERRCVSDYNFTSHLFRGSKGCTFRLVPDDFHDPESRTSEPCEFNDLSLPVLNTQTSGSHKIDICDIYTWSVSECSVKTGAYFSRAGRWVDTWDAGTNQNVFTLSTRNNWMTVMYLMWNNKLPTRYHGYLMSLDVKCKRKFNRSTISSCLLFKTNGTQKEARPTTLPPLNDTIAPGYDEKTPSGDTSHLILIIVLSLVCVLFLLLLVVLLCILYRRRLGRRQSYRPKRRRKAPDEGAVSIEVAQEPSSSNHGNLGTVYDSIKSPTIQSPDYATPDEPANYQDLLPRQPGSPGYMTLMRTDSEGYLLPIDASPPADISLTRPESRAPPRSESRSSSRPESSGSLRPGTSTSSKSKSGTTSRPESSATSIPKFSATLRPESSTTSGSDSSPTSKPGSSPNSGPESSPNSRPESSPDSRPESSTTSRPESSMTSRPESSPNSRPESSAPLSPHEYHVLEEP